MMTPPKRIAALALLFLAGCNLNPEEERSDPYLSYDLYLDDPYVDNLVIFQTGYFDLAPDSVPAFAWHRPAGPRGGARISASVVVREGTRRLYLVDLSPGGDSAWVGNDVLTGCRTVVSVEPPIGCNSLIACTLDSVPKVPVVSADWGMTPLDTGFADTVAAVFRVTLDTAGYGALLPEGYRWDSGDSSVSARGRLDCEAVAE